jgi:hypothetical protein
MGTLIPERGAFFVIKLQFMPGGSPPGTDRRREVSLLDLRQKEIKECAV